MSQTTPAGATAATPGAGIRSTVGRKQARSVRLLTAVFTGLALGTVLRTALPEVYLPLVFILAGGAAMAFGSGLFDRSVRLYATPKGVAFVVATGCFAVELVTAYYLGHFGDFLTGAAAAVAGVLAFLRIR